MASRSREAAARSLGDALHELPVAVAVQRLDEAGSIVCLNEAFTRLFGYTLADIPAVSAWALRAYPDPDYRREVFEVWDAAVDRARRERGRVETMEFRVACRDGAVRDVLIGAAVADDTLFISLTDITRQKQAEQELAAERRQERLREEARRLDREQKLTMSLAAAATVHEIKQPLARILLETQLAIERMRDRSPSSSDMLGHLEDMLAESQHAVEMINRMKTLLRTAEPERRPVDVAEVVMSAILFTRKLVSDHQVVLEPSGLEQAVRVEGDGVQLQAAIINLIRNAVEAIVQSAADRREILIAVRTHDQTVEITVGDSGPGMSPKAIASPLPPTTKPDGMGLGLFLVRTCVENHGGSMTVGRSPLGGAEVRLRLPRNGRPAG